MNRLNATLIVLFNFILLTGCADWNSVPVAIDDNFGNSVRHMVKSQTLNPDAGHADQPVLGLDGKKSEGNMRVYRSGNTDLRYGKLPVKIRIEDSK